MEAAIEYQNTLPEILAECSLTYESPEHLLARANSCPIVPMMLMTQNQLLDMKCLSNEPISSRKSPFFSADARAPSRSFAAPFDRPSPEAHFGFPDPFHFDWPHW